ncbi:4'-phosphopantetheinyl transferase superfamily protein [Deinococcus sp. QL22]|uniref:4'-phosphopantetheinyl transferase family protein n=1 Tax=Deinococcus sp. QL22 TaxID=2939437 RepID=UPI0035301DEB
MSVDPHPITVWHGSIRALASHAKEVVDGAEWAYASSLKYPRHRATVLASRAGFRRVVAQYVAVSPQHLQVTRVCGTCQRPHGPPKLPHAGYPALWTSVSHSGDCLLIAVSTLGPIGVDVEVVRARRTIAATAARCFTPSELAAWEEEPLKDRERTFYQYWTGKEAAFKLYGLVSHPRDIEVTLSRCGAAYARAPDGHDCWPLLSLAVGSVNVAHLCVPKQKHYEALLQTKFTAGAAGTTMSPLPIPVC